MLPPVHRIARPVQYPVLFRGWHIRQPARPPEWVQYEQQLIGAYRVAGAAGQYELYVGEDTDPDFGAAPDQISATLPFSYSVTAPPSGTKEYRLCVRWRSKYGLVSLNQYTRRFNLNASGDVVAYDPSGPEGILLVETEDLHLTVTGHYRHEQDGTDRADYWDVYSKVGSDPVPGVDSPDSEIMKDNYASVPLFVDLGPYEHEDDVRVIVRCRRDSDDADDGNTTVYTHTMASLENYPLWMGGFGT